VDRAIMTTSTFSDGASESQSPAWLGHRTPRSERRGDETYERVASPARDFQSVEGLFEMEDVDQGVQRPVLGEMKAGNGRRHSFKARGVKHLRELPAGTHLEDFVMESPTRTPRQPTGGVPMASLEEEEEACGDGGDDASCTSTDSGSRKTAAMVPGADDVAWARGIGACPICTDASALARRPLSLPTVPEEHTCTRCHKQHNGLSRPLLAAGDDLIFGLLDFGAHTLPSTALPSRRS